jgi:amino acid transporter
VTRIFTVLAWLAILMIAANLIVGLSLGDIRQADPEVLHWATVHRLAGVAAALAVVFANSVVVTYFIGTSRWAREVVETYSLDLDFIRRTTALKRRTFPWATLSMLVIVGVIALGAAADPATSRPETERWITPHLIGSIAGLAFIAWASVIEWNNIYRNQQAILEILAEVRRIRQQRGWEV